VLQCVAVDVAAYSDVLQCSVCSVQTPDVPKKLSITAVLQCVEMCCSVLLW